MSQPIKIVALCFFISGCVSSDNDSNETDEQVKLSALQRQTARLTAEIYFLKEQNAELTKNGALRQIENKQDTVEGSLSKYPDIFGPERTFDQSRQEFSQKKYTDAIVSLKRHRNFFPNAAEAPAVLTLLTECYIKTEQWELGHEISVVFENNFSSSKLIGKSKFLHGIILERLGKKSAAASSYLEASALDPNSETSSSAVEALKNLRAGK